MAAPIQAALAKKQPKAGPRLRPNVIAGLDGAAKQLPPKILLRRDRRATVRGYHCIAGILSTRCELQILTRWRLRSARFLSRRIGR